MKWSGISQVQYKNIQLNKFPYNEHKRDTWKCDWLIGHIIFIKLLVNSRVQEVILWI